MPNLLSRRLALEPEEAFGQVLRELRQAMRLSQEKLAFEAGVDRNYISLIELGKNSPSIKTVFKLCEALNTTPSKFFLLVESKLGS